MGWNPDFKKLMARKGKSKYGAKRTERAGRSFMSKGEADCFDFLSLLQKAGEIRELQTQVTVRMTEAALRWVLDYRFFDVKLGEHVYADFKGFETERWAILKKLWPHYGPGRLRVYKGQGTRMRVVEEIIPLNTDCVLNNSTLPETAHNEGV